MCYGNLMCLTENNNLHTGNATFHMQMYTWVFHKVVGVTIPVIGLTFSLYFEPLNGPTFLLRFTVSFIQLACL